MIFIFNNSNQLCNRLWSYIPVIAEGLEKKEIVYIPFFNEYINALNKKNSHKYIKFITILSFLGRNRSEKISNLIKSLFYNHFTKDRKCKDLYSNSKIKFIDGWKYRNSCKYIQRHAIEIREILKFSKEITHPVDNIFQVHKQTSDIIVGIHMRRGDYKEWLNGKYFFEIDSYKRIINDTRNEFYKKGKYIKFLLCTNEPFNIEEFKDYDCFIIPHTSLYKDLYALSLCDYIIGPPSSYSQFASFMGEVPLKLVKDKNEQICLKDFSRTITLDIFENGNILVV
ncbi:hypothetical protein [uncultured Bacteroides sp.]|uniref:hypothetical protein n=1 Tax=uncultured Bacteroides sp. TaxID=162156 RepID=UPI002AAB5803|nr:hypothetical protein [uncultured Bacteroides sp.]